MDEGNEMDEGKENMDEGNEMDEGKENFEEDDEVHRKMMFRCTVQVLDRGKLLNINVYSNKPSKAALKRFAKQIFEMIDQQLIREIEQKIVQEPDEKFNKAKVELKKQKR